MDPIPQQLLPKVKFDSVPMATWEPHALSKDRQAMGEVDHYIGLATAETPLTIAEEIVMGELAYAGGRTIEGSAHLERAVRLEDGLRYNELPGWYFPLRHFREALLLDAGRPNEAQVVYATDLKKTPNNGYALFGLKHALERQGKRQGASATKKRFNQSWADATHKLSSSRF